MCVFSEHCTPFFMQLPAQRPTHAKTSMFFSHKYPVCGCGFDPFRGENVLGPVRLFCLQQVERVGYITEGFTEVFRNATVPGIRSQSKKLGLGARGPIRRVGVGQGLPHSSSRSRTSRSPRTCRERFAAGTPCGWRRRRRRGFGLRTWQIWLDK